MSPRKLEQKTPTEEELDEFERRKSASPATPPLAPRATASFAGSRSAAVALSGVAIAGFLIAGGVLSYKTMRSGAPGSSAVAVRVEPGSTNAANANSASTRPSPGGHTTGSAQPAATPAVPAVSAVEIRDVLRNPARYIGDEIRVEAPVKRVVSENSFIVHDGSDELLIVSPDSAGRIAPSDRKWLIVGMVMDVRRLPPDVKGDYRGAAFLYAER